MAGILKLIEGAVETAGGIALDIWAGGAGGLGNMLIGAGVGTVISGVGSLIQGDPLKGFSTTTRNPIAPWRVCYGEVSTGGTLVYMNMWGANNQVLDLVVVLAAHTCQSVDELLFDQQRIQIDTTAIPTSAKAGYSIPTPVAGSGTSFTPVQQTINITHIVRSNGVVTVTLPQDIPYLTAGDQMAVQNITGDYTLNGVFPVAQIISRVPSGGTNILTFTYLSGGSNATVDNEGQVKTRWADYGRNVYMEVLTGAQTLGQTFVGMTAGVPWQGTGKLCTPASPQNAGGTALPNPWTNYCSLQGKTAVFIRLQYEQTKFPAGVPQISFKLTGKNDIYDPRTGTYGYTNNAALCIADFLNQGDPTDGRNRTPWGFKAHYGTEIPATYVDGVSIDRGLSAMANICDDTVALAQGGSEPMYTCNGQFELSMKRGEILQNILTSCAGRLSFVGGQYFVQPGYWFGPGATPLQVNLTNIAAGPFRWKPSISIRDLFNGAKGTYISPENHYQSTDFPPYCQDTMHGYSGPSAYGGDILLAADGGDRRWLELHLPFTNSSSMAQRIAKIELLRRRGRSGTMAGTTPTAGYCGSGTFQLNLAGYQFMPLDVFEATVPFLGFTNKLLEVGATRFKITKAKKAVLLGTEIEVQETDSSIYQWSDVEQLTPQGYVQSTYPTGTFQEKYPLPWSPGYVSPLAGDAIGGPATYGIQFVPGIDVQGNASVGAQIKGTSPINSLDSGVAAPLLTCIGSSTGGSIPAGEYVVGLAAFDSGSSTHEDTDYHSLVHVVIGGSGSGSISGSATWGAGDDGGDVYIGVWTAAGFVMHYQQTLTPGQTTFSITSFNQSTAGGPDPLFDHFGVLPFAVEHSGDFDGVIPSTASITATTVTIPAPASTANQWAGYVLSLLGRSSGEVPVINLPIASNTAGAAGLVTFTIGAGVGGTLPDLTTILQAGDLLVMRGKYTFTATSFSDVNVANSYYPTGADQTVEPGHVAIALTGANAGDMKTIRSVTTDTNGNYTVFNLADPWAITPATGDIIVMCSAGGAEFPSPPLTASNSSVCGVMAELPMGVNDNGTWLFVVRAVDSNGLHCPDGLAPMRDVYSFGIPVPTVPVVGPITLSPVTQNVSADASVSGFTVTLPPFASWIGQSITITKVDSTANAVVWQLSSGDSIPGVGSSGSITTQGSNITITAIQA